MLDMKHAVGLRSRDVSELKLTLWVWMETDELWNTELNSTEDRSKNAIINFFMHIR